MNKYVTVSCAAKMFSSCHTSQWFVRANLVVKSGSEGILVWTIFGSRLWINIGPRKETMCFPISANVIEKQLYESNKSQVHRPDKVRATGSLSVSDAHQCKDERPAWHLFWVITPHKPECLSAWSHFFFALSREAHPAPGWSLWWRNRRIKTKVIPKEPNPKSFLFN